MAHIRREFVKVYDSYKLPVAHEAVERIAQLYEVEKRARFKSPLERVLCVRNTRSQYLMIWKFG